MSKTTALEIENIESTKDRLKKFLLLNAFAWFLFGIIHVLQQSFSIAYIDFGTCVVAMVGYVVTRMVSTEKGLRWIGRVSLWLSMLALGFAALNTGRDGSVAVWILCVVPAFACYHMGVRSGFWWTSLTVIVIAVNAIFTAQNWQTAFDFEPQTSELLVGQVLLTVLLFFLTAATRRSAEAHIAALHEREATLKAQAVELTKTAADLRRARDEALQAAEVKAQFLANMSHEIRTPLNGVLGMTNVLLDTGLGSEQRQMVKTIERSGSSLLAIINEVLDFSKLEAGAVQVESIAFDLHECVDDVLDVFSREVEDKGLDLASDIHINVPKWVVGDLVRTRQVLINLVGNAVKFTDDGEVVVSLKLDGNVRFEVTDTGIGIPPDKVDDLFRDFSQVDASTTREFGGTGLGLAISKRLVEILGGEIGVHSEVGEGSTFWFSMPLPEVPSPDRPMTQERISLLGRTMLIVGKPCASRRVLESRAKSWGLRTTSHEDLAGLLQSLADDEAPDVFALFDSDERDAMVNAIENAVDSPGIMLIAELAAAAELEKGSFSELGIVVHRPIRFRRFRQLVEAMVGGWSPETSRSLSAFDPFLAKRIPLRILVAEDNPVNQKVAAAMLERLGYKPDIVGDGQTAIEQYEVGNHDVIFMDIQMPNVDGLEATRRIRERYQDTGRPWIVALSAATLAEQRDGAFEAGVDDFIGKPYEISTLMHSIEQIGRRSSTNLSTTRRSTQTEERDEYVFENLKTLFASDEGKFRSLVESHIENASKLVDTIVEAHHGGDVEQLKLSAHSLKSSSAMFGSRYVSTLAEMLEHNPDSPQADTQVTSLNEAWGRAVTFFEAYVQKEL